MNPSVEQQIQLLWAARSRGREVAEAVEAGTIEQFTRNFLLEPASYARRALSIGDLRRLARALRRVAKDNRHCIGLMPRERGRARCAILAVQIEEIVSRRKAERERRRKGATARHAPLQRPEPAADDTPPGHCRGCRQKLTEPKPGKFHCNSRCRSLAWTRRHRPAEWAKRVARMAARGETVLTAQRGWCHETGRPTMEVVQHG